MGSETDKPHNTFWISGGSGAFRKSYWEKLGGLDTMFNPFYWEDVDLSYRALKRGWKLLWEPKAIVEHRHESTINLKYFSARYLNYVKERNQLLLCWKNLNLGWIVSKHIPGLLWRLRHPGYIVPVLWTLMKLPQVIVRRIQEAKEVKVTDEEVFQRFQ